MSLPPHQARSLPDLAAILRNAVALHQQGHLADAESLYLQALTVAPEQFDALQLLGAIRIQQGRHAEGADLIRRALRVNPNSARALLNLGFALLSLKRADEAATSFSQALALNPGYAQALHGRGAALAQLNRPQEALVDLEQALALRPDDAETLIILGQVLKARGRTEQALASCERALALRPSHADLHNSRGALLHQLKRNEEALASFERALAIEPDHPYAFGGALGSAMVTCDWTKTVNLAAELEARILERKSLVPPFLLLACSGAPALHLQCAKSFIQDRIPVRPPPLWQGAAYHHDRIRVAYVSADFHDHATAYLMAELFERHDRARFGVLGVSFGPDDRSALRRRLVSAFDQFYDVRAKGEREVAALLNEQQVDIAVDLKGLTAGCRPEILAHRPAPIQVNYLGYPGTMGADFIDYVIADKTVLPYDQQPFFTEKIVHLPDCYQVSDSTWTMAPHPPRRQDAGLPDQGIVFCCFNNNHKIAAPVFEVWMRILQKVEGSVLWLLRDNPAAERSLRRVAAA